jgi:hypothetical protein
VWRAVLEPGPHSLGKAVCQIKKLGVFVKLRNWLAWFLKPAIYLPTFQRCVSYYPVSKTRGCCTKLNLPSFFGVFEPRDVVLAADWALWRQGHTGSVRRGIRRGRHH